MNELPVRALFPVSRLCLAIVMLGLILIAGCAVPRLQPAPDARLVPGSDRIAVADSAGVRVTVETGAWTGEPRNLSAEITPLRITIENHGERSVRVRYNDFSLASDAGYRYSSLPPYQIRGSVPGQDYPPFAPRFTWSGFYVAPYYSPYFVGMRPWGDPWAFDGYYYHSHFPLWRVDLPTRDMREMAVPEGVIEPSGSISGFIYFPKLTEGARRFTFVARLVDGRTSGDFGELKIPLEVR